MEEAFKISDKKYEKLFKYCLSKNFEDIGSIKDFLSHKKTNRRGKCAERIFIKPFYFLKLLVAD